MTFKEKLQMEYPECVGDQYGEDGVLACPWFYGYEDVYETTEINLCTDCVACWNREIPDQV